MIFRQPFRGEDRIGVYVLRVNTNVGSSCLREHSRPLHHLRGAAAHPRPNGTTNTDAGVGIGVKNEGNLIFNRKGH